MQLFYEYLKVPVQLVVSRINDLNGVIVWISEHGKLKCSYLGTEPAFINPILKDDLTKEFNFQSAENEYKSLQSKIKSAIMNTGTVVTNKNMTGLILNVEIPNRLDQNNSGRTSRDTELKDPLDSIPSITCKLQLKSAEFIQNVKLNISCTLPIVAVPDTAFYSSIGSVPYDQEVCFYMKTKHIPCNLEVNVCATYSYSTNGAIKITELKFRLPLKLIMKSGQQMNSKMDQDDQRIMGGGEGGANEENKKNYSGLKKIALESNKPCVNLSEIFPEFSASVIPANGNIISAQIYGHANINISIQSSKSGVNRYRFQSENYETLWIILQEFVLRLHTKSQEILLNYQEILPTDDFRFVIDRHLELRQSLERHKENLEKCCVQFRAIQKRLLAKFKDKSPTSLDNMDVLLDATYRQINSVADCYLSTQKELSSETNILNCFSSLYVLLVSLTFKFNKEHLEILESVMITQIGDTTDLVRKNKTGKEKIIF
jgi:Bardet-Biedl syndrome 9 protein